MNKLTATESFLFSLTDSVAKTIPAQRAAIEREGLSQYTTLSEAKARQAIARKDREIEKARQRHLVELFRDQVALNPGLPHWVIACRMKEAPAKVEKGSLIISEPLAKLSYDRTRTLIGNRCKLSTGEVRRIPGVRETDNGKWGWDKVVWRYADYFCALSPHGRQVAFQLTSHDDIHLKSLLNGNIMFAGERLRVFPVPPPYPSTRLKPHTIVRALQNHAHGLTVSWDRSTRQAVLSHGSEQYHTGLPCEGWIPRVRTSEVYRKAVKDAVQAFRKRRDERIETERLAREAAKIYVSLDDSYRAGNCRSMSEQFAREMWQKIGAVGECAVRGDEILRVRDDNYTRRAVSAAMHRV